MTIIEQGAWIPLEEPYVLLFCGGIGVPGVLAGLHLFFHETETVVDNSQVHIKRQGLFGTSLQSVPLSEYRGIFHRVKLLKAALLTRYKGRNVVYRHLLELRHRNDKNKNAVLKISDARRQKSEDRTPKMLTALKKYCRLTGLPGIDESGEEPETITTEP